MSETFELEDEPQEPKPSSMSETFELESDLEDPEEPKSAREPAKPLARLWKTEPDSAEDEAPPPKKSIKDKESEPVRKASDAKGAGSKGKTKAAKGKGPIAADEPMVKKVLIEETPTLDTYETRQRARLIMGSVAALASCSSCGSSTRSSDPIPARPT